jgi:hypothetical protein
MSITKVQFNCNSGANIHSNHVSEWLDVVKDLGLEIGDWDEMSSEDKYKIAEDWANERLEIYYEEE